MKPRGELADEPLRRDEVDGEVVRAERVGPEGDLDLPGVAVDRLGPPDVVAEVVRGLERRVAADRERHGLSGRRAQRARTVSSRTTRIACWSSAARPQVVSMKRFGVVAPSPARRSRCVISSPFGSVKR